MNETVTIWSNLPFSVLFYFYVEIYNFLIFLDKKINAQRGSEICQKLFSANSVICTLLKLPLCLPAQRPPTPGLLPAAGEH